MTLKDYKEEYYSLSRLGAPVLVTQLCVITVSFADTLMVGAYGLNELAAAAFVNSLFLVVIVTLMGFAGGVTPLVGALFSRGDNFKIGQTLRSALAVNTSLSVAATLIMSILYFFIDKMGQPTELLPLIRPYYLIVLCSMIPASIFSCCQQMANGTTDTATPMWVMLGGNILNIIGNYMLIFGKCGLPEMGLLGAGISTLNARILSAITLLCILIFSRRYRPYREGLHSPSISRKSILKIWNTSYPVALQSGVECLLWSFGAVVCGWFGTVQLASYQVANTIGQLGFMIYMSFGVAVSVRVANYWGIGNYHAARKATLAGLHLNTILATIASLAFIFFGEQLISLFNDDPAVVRSGTALLLPLVLYQYCDSIQITYANAQRGTSQARPLMWAALISYMIVGIPASLLLAIPFNMGNIGVYYSFCIALLFAAVLLRYWFQRTYKHAIINANKVLQKES